MKASILWFILLLTCRHTAAAAPVAATIKRSQQPAWVDGLKNGLASALAAGCVKTSLQPIDAIKTIQQYQQAKGSASLTVWEACREIMSRPGGFWNFYAGLGVTVFGAMPSVALYFGVYSYCKKSLLNTNWGKKHPTASVALSAAIGNSVASFSRVPYEVLKQQLQTGVYTSTWHAFKEISSSKQYMSLLFPKGGIAIQMLRDVPYAVITLMLYETLQNAFHKSRSNKLIDFCVGGAAGGIGSWATNPTDVIKTRLQTNSDFYGGSVRACTAEIWREGGAMAFLRGSIPRLVHKVPANAFFFVFYEGFRQVLGVRDNDTGSKDD